MSHPLSIEHDLHSAMAGGGLGDGAFNALALRVFKHQFDNNTAYQNHCKALGVAPENLTHWHEIPAVTTDAFKFVECPLVTFPIGQTQKTFLTSGTTSELKGCHHFPSLDLYDRSITASWQELALPRPENSIFLTPEPGHAPHSSLSHMMGVLSDTHSRKSIWAVDASGRLDMESITAAVTGNRPVALLGTALAYLHLFEQLTHPLTLPPGSWAMETGGYKGTMRQLEKGDLYRMFTNKLGLAPDSIINEYSMTELSSQFYTRGLAHPHTGPSWTRVRVINPFTETDALAGEPGHLVIYDLANLHSVMAIRTQDLASRSGADLADGRNAFTLLGRDPSALPRGCSRAADHQLRPS
ncbi:MAG: hypothetical protein H7A51_05545 [Akkermansiaceae bacterium]|nr:hypothetical protein [Akkermansiaceae bacterium]